MENLISKEYVEKLKQLHQTNPSFGSKNNIPALLKKYLESHETKTVLDYGCGKGNVMKEIKNIFPNLQIQGYDPAVLKGAKALPKDTYVSVPFYFGGSQVKTFLRKSSLGDAKIRFNKR
jgi:ubiquinone/menaquinone biosynthesis C-methylase UbiE